MDNILQEHAPIKERYVRADQFSFIGSKIHREKTKNTRLRNKFIESKTDADRIAYNQEEFICIYSRFVGNTI